MYILWPINYIAMKNNLCILIFLVMACLSCGDVPADLNQKLPESEFIPVFYNNPGLTVDLGVGLWAWPMPMDFDSDGDLDLVVSCPDKPFNGTYFFENPDGNVALPVFLPPVKIAEGKKNVVVSYVDGKPRVSSWVKEYEDFRSKKYTAPKEIFPAERMPEGIGRQRSTILRYKDFNGDGVMDLIAGETMDGIMPSMKMGNGFEVLCVGMLSF